MTQTELAQRLLQLHQGSEPVLFANCWDAASARVLQESGMPAVATSSAAIANTLGYADGERITREEMFAAVRRIVRAVDLPVSADCEAGYAADAAGVAETTRLLLATGAVGMNLEDSVEDESKLVPLERQVEKIKAVRTASAAAGVHLVLNARVDAFFLHGTPPANFFAEAVQRMRAYRAAGADCIFTPGVTDLDVVRRLLHESPGPLNILCGPGTPTVAELRDAGVRRISLGSKPYLAALALLRRTAEEMRASGTFAPLIGGLTYAEVNGWLRH